MRRLPTITAAAAVALACVLTGCSTGGAGGGELSIDDSPLNQYFSAGYNSEGSAEDRKRMEEREKKREELIASCMADEGFEYTPELASFEPADSDEDEIDPMSREYAEVYGYGVVTNPWSSEAEEPEEVNENQLYIDSLSESEATAYYEALYGAEDDNVDEYRWQDAGCLGSAQHELSGEDPWESEQFAGLRDKLQGLYAELERSPELATLDREWANCMQEAGEPGFDTQMSAANSIYDEINRIYEASAESDPEGLGDPNESAEMKALGEREIELALADYDCREETSYMEEALKLQFDLEAQFVDANKADLEAFKTALEQVK
ncbi:MAG: hypothetical protein IR160_05860 [Salinibacterium sp.]|nr:hypothetical protein [Salinibacterium sp.]MBF0672094.1 hypothetical protein [Salinibacterium sp.]